MFFSGGKWLLVSTAGPWFFDNKTDGLYYTVEVKAPGL